jgi:2-methylcitrate dehydratase PrpD
MTFLGPYPAPTAAVPLAVQLGDRLAAIKLADVPASARRVAVDDLIDMAGLCVAARRGDYLAALLAGWDGLGDTTAIGQSRPLDAAGAAIVNGVATHGEDFDDTLEGAPIRVAAMVIPAVLAAAERYGRSGADALRGIVVGLETICRLNLVSPGAIHRAGFHPVGVLGALGAAAGASAALGHSGARLTDALGIAGSLASGTLAYLDDGAWTKRLHPGWAAQSGLRAAVLATTGFVAPRRFLESDHGFFQAFAPRAERHFDEMLDGIGQAWRLERIAFKPYPCGTMIHPYIDCMRRLAAEGVQADDVVEIECETGEGLVNRLWEPLAAKRRPPSGYAAKFSMPYCMAVGFLDGDVGLAQFTDERARNPAVLALAGRIRYVIDPDNEYPANYTGHVRATLRDGSVRELRQPHLRGGAREPLGRDELVAKFRANVGYGGWTPGLGEALLTFCLGIDAAPDLSGLRAFRV